MSDRELLTECLDVLTHDAAQRTFAGGVRMSQLAIKLRAHLAAPRPEPVLDGQSGHPVMLPRAPVPVLGLISDEVRAALKAADAVESQEAYRTRAAPPATAPSEDIETLRRENERLRGLLAEASKAVWMNYDGDLLDRIEAALKEVPP